jgi:prolyl oligopeptidase PreP (S9A serine peptidase family)
MFYCTESTGNIVALNKCVRAFAAKLEEAGASSLLRVETKSGHSGATPMTKIEEYPDVMAFVCKTLKINPK